MKLAEIIRVAVLALLGSGLLPMWVNDLLKPVVEDPQVLTNIVTGLTLAVTLVSWVKDRFVPAIKERRKA